MDDSALVVVEEESPQDIHARLLAYYTDYEEATEDHRKNAKRDRRYYDGDQWDSEEKKILIKRKQPIVTKNRIAPKVNYILGTEISNRVDPSARPRTMAADVDASIAADALNFVADKERYDYLRSDVVKDVAIEGCAGAIVELEIVPEVQEVASRAGMQPTEDGVKKTTVSLGVVKQKIEVKLRLVPWDRLFYDPHSRRADFLDAEYIGTVVWRDFRSVIKDPQYINSVGVLESTKETGGGNEGSAHTDRPSYWYRKLDDRIKIIEIFWREGGDWYAAHMTKTGFLTEPVKVPYLDDNKQNWCPLIATSAFVSQENERYGVCRHMISSQDEINKRSSKALHIMNSRQIWAEDGAVLDPNEAKEQLAKPDGWITLNPSALTDGRIRQAETTDLAQGQFQLLQEAKAEIDIIGPRASAADVQGGSNQPAKLFLAKQEAAAQELRPFFDHIHQWDERLFTAVWCLIKQFWTEERWINVRDDKERKGWRFVALNRKISKGQRVQELIQEGVPPGSAIEQVAGAEGLVALQQVQQAVAAEMQQIMAAVQQGQMPPPQRQPTPEDLQREVLTRLSQLPLAQGEYTQNDVAKLDVDIIIETSPESAVIQHEEFMQLVSLATNQVVQFPPAVYLEASNFRNKRRLMEIMEEANQVNPAEAQAQQQQMMLQMQTMEAQIRLLMAESQRKEAQAQAVQYEAQKNQAMAMKYAAEAGEKTVPGVGFGEEANPGLVPGPGVNPGPPQDAGPVNQGQPMVALPDQGPPMGGPEGVGNV